MSKFFRQLMRSIRSTEITEYQKRTGKRAWKYEWQELKWAAKDTFVNSWLDPITNFIFNVKRCFKWLPIIWKDRDWDYVFILIILEVKLRFTREHLEKYGMSVDAKQDCMEIRKTELALQRLQNIAIYTNKDWENHWIQWPSRMFLDSENECIHSPTEEESKDVRRMMEKENYMFEQDLNFINKQFKKHLRKWWN